MTHEKLCPCLLQSLYHIQTNGGGDLLIESDICITPFDEAKLHVVKRMLEAQSMP